MFEGIIVMMFGTLALSATSRLCLQEWRAWQCEAALFEHAHAKMQGRSPTLRVTRLARIAVDVSLSPTEVVARANCPEIGVRALTLKELIP